ncbi:MAG: CBS domain-containing protein [Flavobacteriales bacterium]|nr:CBS domain-containing protein [Flavobacteriales bacterium]PIE87060.1 MAG: CBS domain-containing protein [Bacteroidota bacterium]
MRAVTLITDEIPPLMHSDSGEKALNWMEEFKVSHLPVLKNGNFVGVISESDLLDQGNPEWTLDKLFQHLPRPYAYEGDHIYQVLAQMAEHKLSLIPILDKDEKYLGCTSVHHLLTLIANTGSIKENGGILVLEMARIDYSMAEIAQIVEGNDAKILSSYIMSSPDSTNIEVTLKINTVELDRIIRSFERYEYIIKASFQKSQYAEDLKFRYDALMNYLNF